MRLEFDNVELIFSGPDDTLEFGGPDIQLASPEGCIAVGSEFRIQQLTSDIRLKIGATTGIILQPIKNGFSQDTRGVGDKSKCAIGIGDVVKVVGASTEFLPITVLRDNQDANPTSDCRPLQGIESQRVGKFTLLLANPEWGSSSEVIAKKRCGIHKPCIVQ